MITDPAKARRMVLVSVFGLLAIAAYRGRLTGSGADVPFAKRVWGVGVVAIILGITADFAPQIAGPFAVLMVVGSLTKGGDQAIQNFLGKASGGGNTTGTFGQTHSLTNQTANNLAQYAGIH